MSKENEEVPASPMTRLLQTPGFSRLCIYAVMGYMTVIDLILFKKEIDQTLTRHPRFSSLLIEKDKKWGKYSWKRTKVDIDNHVFAPDLDPDMDSPDEFVAGYISDLSKRTLDPTKPLWEIHVLNVKTSDANSTVIFKIDHSIGDGVSLISLVLACAKKTSDPELLPTIPSKKRDPTADINGCLIKRVLVLVWKILLITFYTLIDLILGFATMLFLKDTKTPIKGGRGTELSPKRYVHRIVDLNDVKLIKTAMHVSVNDVLVGVTEAGLSRYLNKRYDQKHEENGVEIIKSGNNSLPRNLRVRSFIAFNLRPSPTIKDLAEVMEGKRELNGMWGNMAASILLPLTINLQDDPLAYIYRAKTVMDRRKLSLQPKINSLFFMLVMNVFGTKVAATVASASLYNTTFAFSNVMGPQEEIILFGHPLSYISPTVSGSPQALLIHYQSYANKLVIALAVDEKLIPNPHQLFDDLQNSLQNMKEAVINRGLIKDSELC